MEQLDRLGWVAGFSFESHGARIGIRVTDSAILDRFPPHLPPDWIPIVSSTEAPIVDDLYSLVVGRPDPHGHFRHYHLLYQASGRVARELELAAVLAALESSLHVSVAYRSRSDLFVHAGVVGWQGHAIVIPGRMMTGKSTLVAALVRAGATYYSDEYAVFDTEGWVHPYPKRLNLRGTDSTPGQHVPAGELGERIGTEPLRVGLVVATEYQTDTVWRPELLSPGHAALALLDNTVVVRSRPQLALSILRKALAGAFALKSQRGEAAYTADALLRYVEALPLPADPDQWHLQSTCGSPGQPAS